MQACIVVNPHSAGQERVISDSQSLSCNGHQKREKKKRNKNEGSVHKEADYADVLSFGTSQKENLPPAFHFALLYRFALPTAPSQISKSEKRERFLSRIFDVGVNSQARTQLPPPVPPRPPCFFFQAARVAVRSRFVVVLYEVLWAANPQYKLTPSKGALLEASPFKDFFLLFFLPHFSQYSSPIDSLKIHRVFWGGLETGWLIM